MKSKLLVLVAGLVLLLAGPALAATDVVLDQVDIGNPASEAGHNLDGWGPEEPATHGGNWGGIAAGNCRVIWDVGDDDPSATITLDRCVRPGAAKAIWITHLDGIADDSFEVYVKDVHGADVYVGSYAWSEDTTEFWVTTKFTLPSGEDLQLARGRDVEVMLLATGVKWSGFGTYGQVAFDWIELVGSGKK